MTHTSARFRRRGLLVLATATLVGTAACGSDPQGKAPAASAPPSASTIVSSTTETVTTAPGSTGAPTASNAPTPNGGGAGCSSLPADPEEYADTYIRAWGVGDRATMDCLATPEAVQYSVDFQFSLGPGWTRLRASGEQQTRLVEYGSPNKKTIAQITVDRGLFSGGTAREHAIVTVNVG